MKRHTTLLRALSVFLFGTLLVGCATRPALEPVGPTFSVLTYNVNFGGPQMDDAVAAIASADADVVLLQETTPAWERVIRERLALRYAEMRFHVAARGGAGGLAVLSKAAVTEVAFVEPTVGWFPAWVVTTRTPVGVVQLANVHLRPALNDRGSLTLSSYDDTKPIRVSEVRNLHAHLRSDLPTVVAGDFNEGNDGPSVRWLRDQGFNDALRRYDTSTPTWRWPVGPLTVTARIDHVLHTTDLRCVHARVLKVGGSDHLPVLATFDGGAE